LRRQLNPLGETAERAADLLRWQDVPIVEALAEVLTEISGARIPADSLDARRLAPHLRVTFAVTDGTGPDAEVVAVGKDLLASKELVGGRVRAAVAEAAGHSIERSGITRWDFGDLPAVVHSTITGPDGSDLRVEGYPALLDRGESVEIKVFSKPAIAERIMAGGVRRLVLLAVPVGVRGLEGSVPNRVRLAIPAVPDLTLGKLLRDCIAAAADHVVSAHGGAVRTQEGFDELLAHARDEL